MKKFTTLIVCSLFVLTEIPGQETAMKLYGIKSGIIEYSYSGDKVGKSTLYFDDYGNKSAAYADVVSNGEPSKGWVVSIGETQYMWDPAKTNEGMKVNNPMVKWIKESSKGDINAFYESTYAQIGMTPGPDENFLGKACKVFKGDMGKVLVWNGILMMMEMKMGAFESGQKATSVKTNVPVEAKYFILPKNIKFSEMPMF